MLQRRKRRRLCLGVAWLLLAGGFLTACHRTPPTWENPARPNEPITQDRVCVGLLNPDAEVRGVWIATVGNINYPSRPGLSSAALAEELDDIVAHCRAWGLNTIFFQVRPTADALYRSDLFPASAFVSGVQGQAADGDFDSLAYLIEAAHAARIRVHAWVNPLRVTYGSASRPQTDLTALCETHPARLHPDWTIAYADGKRYFDPGNPDVRDYVAAGVSEIVTRYAVDGVVFDDYFYPYPVSGEDGIVPFDDAASFERYGAADGFDDLAAWRRTNINRLVESCYHAVKEADALCQFGISPFGIWQNDDGQNGGSATRGLEAYASLYCDATAWARGGYVDYLSPQLYWRFSTQAAPYGELSDWWNAALDGTGVKLLISHAAYQYDTWDAPEGELSRQIAYSREALCYRGSLLYGYAALCADSHGIEAELADSFSQEIIYSDAVQTEQPLAFSGVEDGMTVLGDSLTLRGVSDPTVSLLYEGAPVARNKNGDFALTVSLQEGENCLTFAYGGVCCTLTLYAQRP